VDFRHHATIVYHPVRRSSRGKKTKEYAHIGKGQGTGGHRQADYRAFRSSLFATPSSAICDVDIIVYISFGKHFRGYGGLF
jgi:hypothetical protein